MVNEVTIQILERLISGQKNVIKGRREAIKDNKIRISRLESDVKDAEDMIHNGVETIKVLKNAIKTYLD